MRFCSSLTTGSRVAHTFVPALRSVIIRFSRIRSCLLWSGLGLLLIHQHATAENQTFLVVNCPHEAEVRIDDFLTKSTGPSRLFRLSFDQSDLPRRVRISFTEYASKYRTEYEYT